MDLEKILRDIEEQLGALPDESLPPIPPFNEDQSLSYANLTSKSLSVTNFIIGKLSAVLSERSICAPFRICSIGCGNGRLDCLWLSTLVKRFPNLKIQYVGVDMDQTACNFAKRNLSVLEFAEVAVICRDIQDGIDEKKFDFILAVSSFYYLKSPEKGLEVCKNLISPKGIMIVAIVDQKPTFELFLRFWRRQFDYDVSFSSKLTSVIAELEVPFSHDVESDNVDITECLQDDFVTESQRTIMNTLTQVDTFKYPEPLVQKCIDYIRSIAIATSGGSKRILLYNRHYFTLF